MPAELPVERPGWIRLADLVNALPLTKPRVNELRKKFGQTSDLEIKDDRGHVWIHGPSWLVLWANDHGRAAAGRTSNAKQKREEWEAKASELKVRRMLEEVYEADAVAQSFKYWATTLRAFIENLADEQEMQVGLETLEAVEREYNAEFAKAAEAEAKNSNRKASRNGSSPAKNSRRRKQTTFTEDA